MDGTCRVFNHFNDFGLDLQSKERILKPGSNLKRFSFKTKNWRWARMEARRGSRRVDGRGDGRMR